MKKPLSVLFIFLFASCATTQNPSRFAENTFFCDSPKLKVQILKNVVKQKERSKQGPGYRRTSHSYITESGGGVGITFWRFRKASNIEWQNSDEQIMMSIGMVPLDPIRINNQTWIKFVDLKNEKYVAFGYFKRIDWNLVAIYSISKAEQFKNEIESFKNTRVLTASQKQLITKAFNYNANLFVIE